jgi:hypothetical protein
LQSLIELGDMLAQAQTALDSREYKTLEEMLWLCICVGSSIIVTCTL